MLLRRLLACYLALPLMSVTLTGVTSNATGAAPSSIVFASDAPANVATTASPCSLMNSSQQLRRTQSGGTVSPLAMTVVSLEVSLGVAAIRVCSARTAFSSLPPLQVLACSNGTGGNTGTVTMSASLSRLLEELSRGGGNSSLFGPFIVEAAGQSGVSPSEVSVSVQNSAPIAVPSPAASPAPSGSGVSESATSLAVVLGAAVGGSVAVILLLIIVCILVARLQLQRKPPLTSSYEQSNAPQLEVPIDGVNPLTATRNLGSEGGKGSDAGTMLVNPVTSAARGRITRAAVPTVLTADPKKSAGIDGRWTVPNPILRK